MLIDFIYYIVVDSCTGTKSREPTNVSAVHNVTTNLASISISISMVALFACREPGRNSGRGIKTARRETGHPTAHADG